MSRTHTEPPKATAHLAAHSREWKGKKFPGVETEESQTQAFKIVNQWARAQVGFDARVRTMCLLMQAHIGVSDGAFQQALQEVMKGNHTIEMARRILDEDRKQQKMQEPGIGHPTDVVGHIPDPPFEPDPGK